MPAIAKIPTPTHFAASGEDSTSCSESSSAPNASRPYAVHETRYPATNCAIRHVLVAPLERATIVRDHRIATGATDGNIIAAIITTHIVMNSGRLIPIVPGPTPMPRAWSSVTSQASTASRTRAAQAGAICRSGSPAAGRATSLSCVCVAAPLGPDVLVALARVIVVGGLAVAGLERMAEGLQLSGRAADLERRREPEDRVAHHRWAPVLAAERLVRERMPAERAPRLRERDRASFHGERADQPSHVTEGTSRLPRDDLLDRVGLLVARAGVDGNAEPPVPVRDETAVVDEHPDLEAGEVHSVHVALADVEHRDPPADLRSVRVVRRRARGRARAHVRAGTARDVPSGQSPGHRSPPSVTRVGHHPTLGSPLRARWQLFAGAFAFVKS